MPRRGQGIDPERVRRAATAFLDGDCSRAAAAERAGCSRHHITAIVRQLRAERAAAQPAASQLPPAPVRAPAGPRGMLIGNGPESNRAKNTRRAAIVRRTMANNKTSMGG